jgi:hypothetical protein
MRFGNLAFAGYTQQRKEDDHGTAARGEPKGAGDAVVVADQTGAEQRGRPQPGLLGLLDLDAYREVCIEAGVQIRQPMRSGRCGRCGLPS